jgi:hypothetical protein
VYCDVDVKCAHPTLLWQVLASEGLKYEQCKLYAEQSATILQLLMKATQLNKVDCKALLYKMLYRRVAPACDAARRVSAV